MGLFWTPGHARPSVFVHSSWHCQNVGVVLILFNKQNNIHKNWMVKINIDNSAKIILWNTGTRAWKWVFSAWGFMRNTTKLVPDHWWDKADSHRKSALVCPSHQTQAQQFELKQHQIHLKKKTEGQKTQKLSIKGMTWEKNASSSVAGHVPTHGPYPNPKPNPGEGRCMVPNRARPKKPVKKIAKKNNLQ